MICSIFMMCECFNSPRPSRDDLSIMCQDAAIHGVIVEAPYQKCNPAHKDISTRSLGAKQMVVQDQTRWSLSCIPGK